MAIRVTYHECLFQGEILEVISIATSYSFGVIHAEESATEGEADGIAGAECPVVLHAEEDGALDGGGDVDLVVV